MFSSSPGICLITDSRQYPSSPLERQLEAIELAIKSGCDFIQIREKHLSRGELLKFASQALDLARHSSTQIIINRDWEAAVELGAWGAHLNTGQAFPPDAGKLRIGVSSHSSDEAIHAQSAGADYLFLGPLFPPNSKKSDFILGLESFHEITASLSIPVFALGGISIKNAALAIEAGASGIAGIGLLACPELIEVTISELRKEMEKGLTRRT